MVLIPKYSRLTSTRSSSSKNGPKCPKLEVYACILFKWHFGPVFGPFLGLLLWPRNNPIELPLPGITLPRPTRRAGCSSRRSPPRRPRPRSLSSTWEGVQLGLKHCSFSGLNPAGSQFPKVTPGTPCQDHSFIRFWLLFY